MTRATREIEVTVPVGPGSAAAAVAEAKRRTGMSAAVPLRAALTRSGVVYELLAGPTERECRVGVERMRLSEQWGR